TRFLSGGYTYVQTASTLAIEAERADTKRLLGLFNRSNIDGALDRRLLKKGTVTRYPDQPDLTTMTKAALSVLSRNENGFVLMVEAGRIDKYSHSLDWERAVFDTIMFDNTVKIAKDFAAASNDTLVVVVADHTHPAAIIGTYADNPDGSTASLAPRDRLRLYGAAEFPSYGLPDADGFPASIDVSKRLAFVFAAFPDHCDAGRPYLAGENKPAVLDADKKVATANEAQCALPGIARRTGNLPLVADRGIHSGEDVVLTALGPGADQFRGRIDNTGVFRRIAIALGLGSAPPR
ncbi:MAG: alkaline phosphatase, partial [Hyphomicrobiaceae bacterium]|nr:alkaline phosphatase [Hyphomicrobiaceae bacterium]